MFILETSDNDDSPPPSVARTYSPYLSLTFPLLNFSYLLSELAL